MRIERVDARDERALADWYAVMRASEEHERPGEPGWLLHELRAKVLTGAGPDPDSAVLLWAARDGDRVVGAARADLPRRDNTHLAEVELYAHPEHRRRGAGRALLAAVERELVARGRSTLLGYSDEPPGRPSAMTAGAGSALGFAVGQTEARRDIDLPLDATRAAALEREIAPHVEDYDVVVWQGAVPEAHVDDLAVLHQRMSTDVPMGDLDITEEAFDAARVRRWEALAAEMDRLMVGAGAVHRATGRLVAYTDQAVPRQAPVRAYQWNTIVLPEHRGHRLGTLVKLACLRELPRAVPEVRWISTWNAEENQPMIRVNDALGARVTGGSRAWQKRL